MRIIQISLKDDSDVLQLRRRTKELAQLAGIRDGEIVKLVTAVSEIARNALHYAKTGTAQIEIHPDDVTNGPQYLRVRVADQGKGIADLETILEGRYVSKTGLGKGLLGSKKLVDRFDIETSPGGTTVTLAKEISPVSPRQVHTWSGSLEIEPNINAVEEIQRQNQELLAALSTAETLRQTVEEANQQKSNFLANMSHEIRTPMNAIVGITNILWRSELNSDQRNLVHGLRDAGNSLLAVINDILDLSKIEAGKLQIETALFDPIETTCSITSLMKLSAEEKGLKLATLIDVRTPRKVIGDQMRFRQILLNLISNAIKYTREGEILVYMSGSKDGKTFRCAVCDTGIGMSAADLKRSFEPFEQIVKKENRGTGLGLPIVKRLADLMDGTLLSMSLNGVGSSFALELPCGEVKTDNKDGEFCQVEQSDSRKQLSTQEKTYSIDKRDSTLEMYLSAMGWQAIDKSQNPEADFTISDKDVRLDINEQQFSMPLQVTPVVLANHLTDFIVEPYATPEIHQFDHGTGLQTGRFSELKVLLVEDHPLNQLVMTTELKDRSIEVDVASTGKEALARTQSESYDIILMDCQLSDTDGYEVTRLIREFEQKIGRRTPIVAVTGYAMRGDRERCLSAGMDDYISKPVQIAELVRVLEQWTSFDSKDRESGLALQTTKAETAKAETTKAEITKTQTTAIDSSFEPINLSVLLARFKPEAAKRILEVFIEEGDLSLKELMGLVEANSETYETIARQMHSMKGACGIVFADPLMELTAAIERAAKSKDFSKISTLSREFNVLYNETKKFIETKALQRLREGSHPG